MEFFETISGQESHPILSKILPLIESLDGEQIEGGQHRVNDELYYNVILYDSKTPDQRPWESHKKDYDIHFIISGEERIHHNFLSQMILGEYVEEEDFQQMTGDEASQIVLKPGNVLILDSNDAHKTGLMVSESVAIKKIVFKLAMP